VTVQNPFDIPLDQLDPGDIKQRKLWELTELSEAPASINRRYVKDGVVQQLTLRARTYEFLITVVGAADEDLLARGWEPLIERAAGNAAVTNNVSVDATGNAIPRDSVDDYGRYPGQELQFHCQQVKISREAPGADPKLEFWISFKEGEKIGQYAEVYETKSDKVWRDLLPTNVVILPMGDDKPPVALRDALDLQFTFACDFWLDVVVSKNLKKNSAKRVYYINFRGVSAK